MAATHPFNVIVTDSLGVQATQAFTLNLAAAPATSGYTVHQASGYPLAHTAALSGTAPINCTALGLPAGMTFNNTTKQFVAAAGAVAAGVYSVTLNCTNCASSSASATYTFRVF